MDLVVYLCPISIALYRYAAKSRGQILWVAATLHVLFHMDTIPNEISTDALKAAIEFVEVCNQHVAYIAGRGRIIADAIKQLQDVQKDNKNMRSKLLPGSIKMINVIKPQELKGHLKNPRLRCTAMLPFHSCSLARFSTCTLSPL